MELLRSLWEDGSPRTTGRDYPFGWAAPANPKPLNSELRLCCDIRFPVRGYSDSLRKFFDAVFTERLARLCHKPPTHQRINDAVTGESEVVYENEFARRRQLS